MSRVRFEHSTFLQTLIIYPVLFTALYLEYFIDSFLLCLVISAFFWFALRAIWRKCRKKSLEENYRPYPDYTNPTQTALQAHEPYSNTTPNPVRVGPSLVKPVAENPNPITIEKPKPLILDPPMPRLSPADMFAIADGWWVSQITEFRACTTVDTPVPLPDKSDRFIFSSMSAPGTTYITSMRGCTCPAYTTGKTIPCKHMVRLALFRGYYDIRYPANRAHGNIQFDGSHGDDVEHPTPRPVGSDATYFSFLRQYLHELRNMQSLYFSLVSTYALPDDPHAISDQFCSQAVEAINSAYRVVVALSDKFLDDKTWIGRIPYTDLRCSLAETSLDLTGALTSFSGFFVRLSNLLSSNALTINEYASIRDGVASSVERFRSSISRLETVCRKYKLL